MAIDKLYNPNNAKQPEGPPYKGYNNRWLTAALFLNKYLESPGTANFLPVFTLRECWESREYGLIPVKETFIEEGDPTGHRWAMKYLGAYEPYRRLMNNRSFVEFMEEEVFPDLQENLKSKALERILEIMENGSDGQALAAAKYVAEEGWKKAGRGRPSKSEIKGELKKAMNLSKEEAEDMARIGLVVDNTKKAN